MSEIRKNLNNINPADSSPHATSTPPTPVNLQPQDLNQIDSKQKTIEGYGAAISDSVKESEKNKARFEDLVDLSSKVLFKTNTIFPFKIFPTEIIIDLAKVTIIDHIFFGNQVVHSMYVDNITDVLVTASFFSATLSIVGSGFHEPNIDIKPLVIEDAKKARRIIQGIIIAKKQQIDFSKIEYIPNLVQKLEALGEYKAN